MCIGVWTLEHPDYALILFTNRDEYLDRPTQDAHFHSFQDGDYCREPSLRLGNILSGRDVKAGGSWFGLNKTGRVALLTNITEPPKSFSSSRGHLVSSFLLSDSSLPLEEEVGRIVSQGAEFAGFNLLLLAPAPPSPSVNPKETQTEEGKGREPQPKSEETLVPSQKRKLKYDVMLVTNHGAGGRLQARQLAPTERACGCVSNGVDGKGGEKWPKVQKAIHDFGAVLQTPPICAPQTLNENDLIEKLFEILTWRSPDPITERAQLRNTIQVPPITINLSPSSAKVHDTPPSSGLSETASVTTSSNAPPANTVLSDKPQMQPAVPGSQYYYGTRLSTVLLIRRDGSVVFIEKDIWRLGKDGKPERLDQREHRKESDARRRVFEFQLDLKLGPCVF